MTFLADARPKLTEARFQAQVFRLAEVLGYRCYHTHDSRRSAPGFPDAVLLRRPRVLFVEFKSERGRLSPEQLWWLCELRSSGQEAYVWRPSDIDKLTRILRGERDRA